MRAFKSLFKKKKKPDSLGKSEQLFLSKGGDQFDKLGRKKTLDDDSMMNGDSDFEENDIQKSLEEFENMTLEQIDEQIKKQRTLINPKQLINARKLWNNQGNKPPGEVYVEKFADIDSVTADKVNDLGVELVIEKVTCSECKQQDVDITDPSAFSL